MKLYSGTALVICSVLLVHASGHAVAQDRSASAPQAAALAGRLDELSENLGEIARSLRALLDNQDKLLLLRRIELAERRLEPLGSEVRRAASAVRNHEEEIAHIEQVRESFEREIDEAVRSGADPQQLSQRGELQNLESMIALQQQLLENARRSVIEAENDLARGRNEIAILDEQLQELLER